MNGIAIHINRMKWKLAGHNARYTDNRFNYCVQHWRPWSRTRWRGRPLLGWADDIKKIYGYDWIRKVAAR